MTGKMVTGEKMSCLDRTNRHLGTPRIGRWGERRQHWQFTFVWKIFTLLISKCWTPGIWGLCVFQFLKKEGQLSLWKLKNGKGKASVLAADHSVGEDREKFKEISNHVSLPPGSMSLGKQLWNYYITHPSFLLQNSGSDSNIAWPSSALPPGGGPLWPFAQTDSSRGCFPSSSPKTHS